MSSTPRRTRAQRKQLLQDQRLGPTTKPIDLTVGPSPSHPAFHPDAPASATPTSISSLPSPLPRSHSNLLPQDHALLLKKQSLLRSSPLPRTSSAATPLQAALVFAQSEAGTAVCIHPSGLLLTCSHCIAETPSDLDVTKTHYLLFASGVIVAAKCTAWDGKRDLALLQITAAQGQPGAQFHAMSIAEEAPKVGARLLCVGHPGSEDLECEEQGVATGYDVLHVSKGAFRGYAAGQDVHDNEEIGALMHDCWTYWGHSGAPLVEVKTGMLVGLHSSWDEETGMRRGVGLEAVKEFIREKVALQGC